MNKILAGLLAFGSITSFSNEYYYCVKSQNFPLPNLYVLEIDTSVVLRDGYLNKYFPWQESGEYLNSPISDISISKKWFSFGEEYSYKMHVENIFTDYYFNCKRVNKFPVKIQALADDIGPESNY